MIMSSRLMIVQQIELKEDNVYYEPPANIGSVLLSKLNGQRFNKCFLIKIPPQLQISNSCSEKIRLFVQPGTFKDKDHLEVYYESLNQL